MITIGGFNLDDSYAPMVNISYEYFKTQSGEIIGGNQIATINGTVTVPDGDGVKTGAIVMQKLKGIRNLGKQTKCAPVTIPGFSAPEGKITSVSIDQGPDPAWISEGAFTIEVKGPLSSIPANSYGIVATDCVTDISRSESIEIGEDSHGYVFLADGTLSKSYVKFSNSINLTCKPLCVSGGGAGGLTFAVFTKVFKIGINKTIFNQYKSWKPYLQSRNLEINTDGSISFRADMILLPPGPAGSAFVDLSFGHTQDYQSKSKSKNISGTVSGLASISWTDPAALTDTFSASKMANALSVFQSIKSSYSNLSAWSKGGISLDLQLQPNCPRDTANTACSDDSDDDNMNDCIKPSSSTISISRTDGTINFNFEWANSDSNDGCIVNGVKKEITVEVIDPQAQLVEHVLPGKGTLIQNLNCKNAKRVSVTVSVTTPTDSCNTKAGCEAEDGIKVDAAKYLNDGFYLLVGHTKNTSTNNVTIKQDYIKCGTT